MEIVPDMEMPLIVVDLAALARQGVAAVRIIPPPTSLCTAVVAVEEEAMGHLDLMALRVAMRPGAAEVALEALAEVEAEEVQVCKSMTTRMIIFTEEATESQGPMGQWALTVLEETVAPVLSSLQPSTTNGGMETNENCTDRERLRPLGCIS